MFNELNHMRKKIVAIKLHLALTLFIKETKYAFMFEVFGG